MEDISSTSRKDVYFVIDDSYSMSGYSKIVRDAINAAVSADRNTPKTSYQYKFISFSSYATYADNLSQLPIAHGTTNIESAFKLLDEKVASSLLPEELIIIFISDGHDDNKRSINQRLHNLSGTQRFVKSTLFTIAVGTNFPTSMVVSALRPNYHNASDCLPLVFPITSTVSTVTAEIMSVFEKMSDYVFNQDHFNVSFAFDESSSLEEIENGIDLVYNYFTVKCANELNRDSSIALIKEANERLGQMLDLAKKKEEEKKDALSDAMKDKARKPLASSILNIARSQRKRVQTSILNCITRFNKILEETVKGNLLSKLSDSEQQKVLSYGNVVGKHLVKSLKYHSADFEATKMHLAKVLAEYDEDQAAADDQVCDYIITQAEAITDARDYSKEVLDNAESLVSVVDTVAVVGRLINIKTCNGTQINPWLIEVVSLPTILQHMNTVDFFRLHSGNYHDTNRHGEVANCLIPVTKNTSSKNFLRGQLGAHICTYLLCKNQELLFSDSLIAMQAALATYCLQRCEEFYQRVLEETYNSHECLNASVGLSSPNFFKYAEHAGTDKFREALVTESDSLPKYLKCQHLTKFIFALYVLIRNGRKFSSKQLLDRMRACMVEMVGRGGQGGQDAIYQFIKHEKKHSPSEVMSMISTAEALKAFSLHEGNQIFAARVNELCKTSDACSVCVQGPDDIPVAHMGLTRAKLSVIFARLNEICGNAPCSDFELPDREERLAITYHGLAYSSFERNITRASVETIQVGHLQKEIEKSYASSLCKQAEPFFTPIFCNYFKQTHQYQEVLLPPEYRNRYKAETGRDITDDFGVSEETWLPTAACASPTCPNFLRRLGKLSETQYGKPRIADELLRHLQTEPLFMIQGGNRCAKELVDQGDVSKEHFLQKVSLLREGELIREGGGDMKKRKACQVENVEHMGGEEQLRQLVQKKMYQYQTHQTNDSYTKFKDMMDAAYRLPAMVSAAQSCQVSDNLTDDGFEIIDAAQESTTLEFPIVP